MRIQRALLAAVIGLLLTVAACGDEDGTEPAPPPEAAGSESASKPVREAKEKPKPGTEITVSSSQFGEIIFSAGNQAIYLFDQEATSRPECYGDCAVAWPPVLTEGKPVASGDAKRALLGTTERNDGTIQVTYAGQPLYYYAHEGPGQVLCHNVSEFGGLWLVLDADGNALA